MRAILLKDFGDRSNLFLGAADAPALGPNQIRVQVKATGVNRADVQQRKGLYPPPPGESDILGLEAAGVVLEVASGVTEWNAGDRVMVLLAGGGYAEEVCVDAGLAIRIPDSMDDVHAAAAVEAYLTAFHNLFRLGGLAGGESCLVHAGASSVGLASIQLVRGIVERIFVTVGSPEKAEVCDRQGAVPILYKNEDFAEVIQRETKKQGVHVILDPIGATYLTQNLDSLHVEGRLILIGLLGGREATVDLRRILMKRLRVIGSTLRALPVDQKRTIVREFLAKFGDALSTGKLVPIVDSKFAAADVADAHARMESNANTGKIVLTW